MDDQTFTTRSSVLVQLRERIEKRRLQKENDVQLMSDTLSYLLSIKEHWWCDESLRDLMIETTYLFSLDENDAIKNYKMKLNNELSSCRDCLEAYYKATEELYSRYQQDFSPKRVEEFFHTKMKQWNQGRVRENLSQYFNNIQLIENTTPELTVQLTNAIYEILLSPNILEDREIDRVFVDLIIEFSKHAFLKVALNRLLPGIVLLLVHDDMTMREWAKKNITSLIASPHSTNIGLDLFNDLKMPFTLILKQLDKLEKNEINPANISEEHYNLTTTVLYYWKALRLLLLKMDCTAIMEGLCKIGIDVLQIVLDRLKKQGQVPLFILAIRLFDILIKNTGGLIFQEAQMRTADYIKDLIVQIFTHPAFEQTLTLFYATEEEQIYSRRRAALNWTLSFQLAFIDDPIFLDVTNVLLTNLLERLQHEHWPEQSRFLAIETAMSLIRKCYDIGLIPFKALNEYGDKLITIIEAPSNSILAESRKKYNGFFALVLNADTNSIRDTYIKLYNTKFILSPNTQLGICHKIWLKLCQLPYDTVGQELFIIMLGAFEKIAMVDPTTVRFDNGDANRLELKRFIETAIFTLRSHLLKFLMNISELDSKLIRELLHLPVVLQALMVCAGSPDLDIRSIPVILIKEAYSEIIKSDGMKSLFLDIANSAFDGTNAMFHQFIELSEKGCNTFSLAEPVFDWHKDVVDVLLGEDGLLNNSTTLGQSNFSSSSESLISFWNESWRIFSIAFIAGYKWADEQKPSEVVQAVVPIMEIAITIISSHRTFEQTIQILNDSERNDDQTLSFSYMQPSRLNYDQVSATLDSLGDWIYVTSPEVLRKIVPLTCAMLKRLASVNIKASDKAFDALMSAATGIAPSRLSEMDREDLFTALSAHEPSNDFSEAVDGTETTMILDDEDEKPATRLNKHQDFSTSKVSATKITGTLRQQKITDVMQLPKNNSSASMLDKEEMKSTDVNFPEAVVISDDSLDSMDDDIVFMDIPMIDSNSHTLSSSKPSISTSLTSSTTSKTKTAEITAQRRFSFPAIHTASLKTPKPSSGVVPSKPTASGGTSKLKELKAKFKAEESLMQASGNKQEFLEKRKALLASKAQANVIKQSPSTPRHKEDSVELSSSESSEDSDEESGIAAIASDYQSPPKPRSKPIKLRQEERRTTKLIEVPKAGRDSIQLKMAIMKSEKAKRMKLAPDLSKLHKRILAWDINNLGDIPPDAVDIQFRNVPDKFVNAQEYITVFEPLLMLEIWQQLLRGKEESSEADVVDCFLETRCTVDDFFDITFLTSIVSAKNFGENDVVFFANQLDNFFGINQNMKPWKGRGFLGKVEKINTMRGGDRAEIIVKSYLRPDQYHISASLNPKSLWRSLKLFSLTTVHREYSALHGLAYYDLCDDILNPVFMEKPSITDSVKNQCMGRYQVNEPQAEAILGAVRKKKGFTLIQGPPGTGKTKTILGLLGMLLSQKQPKAIPIPNQLPGHEVTLKLLVCAPSNAAVDEIVKRLIGGILSENGEIIKPNVVRVGTSDSVNSSAKDVFLDTLVEKELNATMALKHLTDQIPANTSTLREQHNRIMNQINDFRTKRAQVQREPAQERAIDTQIKALIVRKRELEVQLDAERDEHTNRHRDAEFAKRRARQKILTQADVMCCTLSGSGHEILANLNISFETVVIDEAAQSIEIASLIPLRYDCKRCILVGDPNQLPPTVLSQLASRYSYQQSLFVRLQKASPDSIYLLSIQYRMHPDISAFPSKLFYNSRLKDGPDMAQSTLAPWHKHFNFPPYRFFNVREGKEQRGASNSTFNPVEAEAAVALLDFLATQFPKVNFGNRVGVITPYKQQLTHLKRVFEKRFGRRILEFVDFNTVDGFQGQEKDIIIFSCVRAGSDHGIGFLSDIRRMNVGLTRAKSSLFILGHADSLASHEFWGDLVEDAKVRGMLVDCEKPYFNHHIKQATVPENMFQRNIIVNKPLKNIPATRPPLPPSKEVAQLKRKADDFVEKGTPKDTLSDPLGKSRPTKRRLSDSIGDIFTQEPAIKRPTPSSSKSTPRKISLEEYKAMRSSDNTIPDADEISPKVTSIPSSSSTLALSNPQSLRSLPPPPPKIQTNGPNIFVTKKKERPRGNEEKSPVNRVSVKERLAMETTVISESMKRPPLNQRRDSGKKSRGTTFLFDDIMNHIEKKK